MAAPTPALLAFPVEPGGSDAWIAALAGALKAQGARPVVVDAFRGQVTQALGLKPGHDLIELLSGRRSLDAVARCNASGVYGVRAAQGVEFFVGSGDTPSRLLSCFGQLPQRFDLVLLVMSAAELASLASPGRTVPVVVLDDSEQGLVHAYAMVKRLACGFGYRRFALVARGMADAAQAQQAHQRFANVAAGFLDAEVSLSGWLPAAPAHAHYHLAELAHTLWRSVATPLGPH